MPIRRTLAAVVTMILAAPLAVHSGDAVTHARGVAPHKGIDGIYQRFSEAYDALDSSALAALYTPDAFYLGPGRDVLRGNPAIKAAFSRSFARSSEEGSELEISFKILDRGIRKNLAYDVGIYTLVRSNDGEEASRSLGKFAVVVRRAKDGSWRFHVDSYSGVPEEGPGPE